MQRAPDRTIIFSAGDEFMDMTQSHTANIASGSLAHTSQKQTIDESPPQKEQPRDARVPGASLSGMDQGFKDFFVGLFKTKSTVPGHEVTIEMINLAFFNLFAFWCSDLCDMNPQQIRFEAEDDRRDKTVRFSADDGCMDVTQSHTVNIATHNLYAESGRLKNAETGLPNYKGMKPANTRTFSVIKTISCLLLIHYFYT